MALSADTFDHGIKKSDDWWSSDFDPSKIFAQKFGAIFIGILFNRRFLLA